MVHRIMAAMVVTLTLAMAGVAAAAEVTYVLYNGQRFSGTLIYHRDANIGLIINGQERSFPASDVAVILYAPGDPSASELDQLPTSDNPPELERHTLVLRNGRILHGKVYHWESDKMIFDTTAGRGDYNASDISRLYLTGPRARSVFNAPADQPGNAGRGRGRTRNREAEASTRVEANQAWTDTGLIVRRGDASRSRRAGRSPSART